jgi:ABC-2 type transport system permease protein
MIGAIRSELLKLRTTRTTLGILLAAVAIVAVTTIVPLALADSSAAPDLSLWDERTQRSIFVAPAAATMFAAFAGLLLVTGEYRHGTVRPTFVFVPQRTRVVVAKLAASMLAGVLIGAVAVAMTDGVAIPWLDAKDVMRLLTTEELVKVALGVLAACVLWSAIGVGLGAIVRSQVGGIVGLIAWSVVESILGGVAPEVGRFTPGEASSALARAEGARLEPIAGLGVLAAWAAVFAIAGVVATARRDVP